MIKICLAIIALYILFQGPNSLAAEYKGTVTRVIDGDSIEVSEDNRAVIVRLHGVDAPEISQPYGRIAMVAVFRQAFGKVVRIETYGVDSHGRTIANVYLPDDTLLNEELLRLGLAWWYCKTLKMKFCVNSNLRPVMLSLAYGKTLTPVPLGFSASAMAPS